MRLVWALLFTLVLAGCGGPELDADASELNESAPPACVSACGLRVFDSAVCQEIDAVEASLVSAFSDLWPDSCQYLSGLSLHVDPERLSPLGYEDLVEPATLSVSVASPEIRTSGAFVHAFVHVADWRDDVGPAGLDHDGWDARGLLARMNLWHSAQF